MNRIYKLKFDKRRNELVVVSEITAGVGKAKATGCVDVAERARRGVRSMALSMLTVMIMMVHPVTAANLPTGGQIVAGSGSIQTPSGNQMDIHQNSQDMVANWHSFDIGKGSTVQFYQPNSSATALNRVVGGGESQIMGNLKANGQVFLVNPNGVLFGKGASVSTSGFVATTRDIENDDFINHRYTFSGEQKAGAAIVNQGALTTTPGGYIVLAADKVSNNGTIRTPSGKAVLAATDRVTLQLDNGGLTSVQVTGDVVNALVENRGLVSASDGQVYLTAHGRDMMMNTVLNVSGVVEAGGMRRQDGNIVLDGGESGVVNLSGSLQADNMSGKGGKVVVQGQNLLLGKGSSITATGGQGGGDVYIGGGWQGKDVSIRNADKVVMQDGSRIDVSATQQGNGGTAVLWSESLTNFHGQISAKGGDKGGNGGQVETSSLGNLQVFGAVSASAGKGKAGNWLLDPLDITIVNGSSTSVSENTDTSGLFEVTPEASGSQVSNTSISNELNNGTSVTILTQSQTAGGNQSGNITVNADISKNGGGDASLTLKANGNITIQSHNITSTVGKLNISLLGAGSNSAMVHLNGSTLQSNGGDITVGRMAGGEANALTVKVFNSTLNTSASSGNDRGNITISAWNPDVNLSESAFVNTVRNAGSLLSLDGCSSFSGGIITLAGTQSGGNSRHLPVWVNNSTLSATGNITLTGNNTNAPNVAWLELRGTTTLTSESGNISISNSADNKGVLLNGTVTLNASNGSITLNGSGGGVSILGNGNILNAAENISLTGVSNISSNPGVALQNTSLVSTNGSINVSGTGKVPTNGVVVSNANLSAANGSVTINGTAERTMSAYFGYEGVALSRVNNISARNIAVNGRYTGTEKPDSFALGKGIFFDNTTTSFTGETILNGTAEYGNGMAVALNTTLVFNNGTVDIHAKSNITQELVDYYSRQDPGTYRTDHLSAFNFLNNGETTGRLYMVLNNTNLTFDADGGKGNGIGGAFNVANSWITINGTGNANINGSSSGNLHGISQIKMDTSGVNGTVNLNGTSQNGSGVVLVSSKLTNTNITGSSLSGRGAGVNFWGSSALNNTTVSGSSVDGTGVSLCGTVIGGQISGSATGSGTGVNLWGTGVLNNTTVSGSSVDGAGVNISGKLTSTGNSAVSGNATGSGTGVSLSGNITDGNISGSATGSGTGVNIRGNSALNNTTVSGSGVDGAGVDISGKLTSTGNSAVSGNATGSGTGV
ncbi:filamentous hemagglutinin N-terminal domain-containing protein, partial [Cronobacter sp. EKM101R]